uniref:Ribosomal protein L29 n=1 Tax=Eustigmatophyceae sp. Mont 10/10-1w TaxID=2506145 RepID=A0A451FMN4_9STRA|nr:ribosomal protein L29 [Eustigmatophyceae sp. Mont 10/10-1w]QAA11672.1 ribosomal protein L29 [Eustigmatophyceae sp. Mont 10/10-1w]
MSLPKYDVLKNLSSSEIEEKILVLKKELLYLRIQNANFSNKSPHLIKSTKHQLAQLLTFQRQNYQTPLKKGVKKK